MLTLKFKTVAEQRPVHGQDVTCLRTGFDFNSEKST